jgi:hypothetical protein
MSVSVTNPTEQSPTLEYFTPSAHREISTFYWIPNFHYRINKRPPVLSQMNAVPYSYCHVFMVVTNNNGFELDDWIYW